MGLLAFVLTFAALGLGFRCWWLHAELTVRTEELAQVRRQLDLYLSDDQRIFDMLWNRAQMETARVMQARKQR
jgi:hypothetical protein